MSFEDRGYEPVQRNEGENNQHQANQPVSAEAVPNQRIGAQQGRGGVTSGPTEIRNFLRAKEPGRKGRLSHHPIVVSGSSPDCQDQKRSHRKKNHAEGQLFEEAWIRGGRGYYPSN